MRKRYARKMKKKNIRILKRKKIETKPKENLLNDREKQKQPCSLIDMLLSAAEESKKIGNNGSTNVKAIIKDGYLHLLATANTLAESMKIEYTPRNLIKTFSSNFDLKDSKYIYM